MTDSIQHQKVLKGAVEFQASAFTEVGNIYAPFYRQAHLRSYYELENGGKEYITQLVDSWMGEYMVDENGDPWYDSSNPTLENGGYEQVLSDVLGWQGELVENPNWSRVSETVYTSNWQGEWTPDSYDTSVTPTLENGGLIYQ